MKLLKPIITIIIMGLLAIPLIGCNSEPEEEVPEDQPAAVQRGNLTIDITAAGNLALSRTEDLAIDLFFQEGTIEEVLVEAGDIVEEGQVLVRLDIEEWEDELSTLEDLIIAKERDLLQANINLHTAEQNLKNARDNVATKELAVLNAQISLQQAESNLATGISAIDLEAVKAELMKARTWYDYVERMLREGELDADEWLLQMERAQENLDVAQANYDNTLAGYDSREINLKKKQVEAAEKSLAQAEEDLTDVTNDVELKELLVSLSQGKLVDAEKSLADIQKDLEEAQSKSPEITAPFDGFITSVKVEGGDEVLKGTVAIQIADPNKFEADILVSEMDILQVQLGGEAWVDVDAMQGLSLPAAVTHIAPTATIQSGVVNYAVKVEVESLEAVAREGEEKMQQAMADIAAGELPPPLQQAVDEGRMTQEEAEELMKQGPPEGFSPPEGFTPPEGMEFPVGMEAPVAGQISLEIPEDFQLREGLTVTVSIIVAESNDVLMVPNAAITAEGMQSYVQVALPSGETEKRAIQTGLNNYQFTEVTEGLSEDEQVMVPQGTVTTSAEQGPRGMMFFGGPPRR